MAQILPPDVNAHRAKSQGDEHANEKAHVNSAMQSAVFQSEDTDGSIDDVDLSTLSLDGGFDYSALLRADNVVGPQHAKPENPGGGKGGNDGGGGNGGGKGGGGKNKAPQAEDDTANTPVDQSIVIDVLANDTDRNGDTLTVVSATAATNGTIVDNGDGTITYTPDAGYEGTDTFTYTISDGKGGESTATVTVTVGTPNTAPNAVNDSASTNIDEAVVVNVLANDSDAEGDTLTITSVGAAMNGTIIDNGDGTITYTPDEGYEGTDAFTYTISDGNGGTDTATVTINVAAETPYYIEALQSGYEWAKTVLTYQFVDHLPAYYGSTADEANNFMAFNQTMINATYQILDMVTTMVNLEFLETTDNYGDITFASANLGSGVGAWAYYPYSQSDNSRAGDIWVNNLYSQGLNPNEGNWGYFVLIHELGHALGLKHSFDAPALPAAEDNHQYSVMSYTYDDNGNYSETFALYDIAALQDLYGANTTHNAGDTLYDLTDYYDSNQAIWDVGGIDTFDGSSETSNLIIDLNEGSFSSIGSIENLAIAYDVEIENANGGLGNDTLIGNNLVNVLNGGSGNDTLYYSDEDILDGGYGNDTLVAMYESIIDAGSSLLSGFENFDLTNALADVVHIVLSDILVLSDNDDLYIFGDDALDTINLNGGSYTGDIDVSGTTYAHYTNGAADLYIENTLIVNVTGAI